MRSGKLFSNGCLEVHPRFAGLDALVPRVINVCVASSSAVSVPGTAATATTDFSRFINDTAFGTYGTEGRLYD